MHSQTLVKLIFSLLGTTLAQFPHSPDGITEVPSTIYPGASISYKQTSICETTPGVNAYAGYIRLPATLLAPLELTPNNINTFFWYFSARNNTQNAPLAIWHGGGPGESGLGGATTENGPCYINEDMTTTLNEFSLNNVANVIYIDSPNTSGYSYSSLMNGTLDQTNATEPLTEGISNLHPPIRTGGIFPTQDPSTLINTTATAAKVVWHVMQEFIADFPEYKTDDKRISLFTNSYGGYFGPAIMDHFVQQNALLYDKNTTGSSTSNPTSATTEDCEKPTPVNPDPSDLLPSGARMLELDTLGFTNGCVDLYTQAQSWAMFAANNTYNHPIVSPEFSQQALTNITQPGGCMDQILQCRAAAAQVDSLDHATNDTVNQWCDDATMCMQPIVIGDGVSINGTDVYDISQPAAASKPPVWNIPYFNNATIQSNLGVPLNWSAQSMAITNAFLMLTGDSARQDVSALRRVLDAGVKVAMVYGDLDHRCNWLGGENVSITTPYSSSPAFNRAGYTPISLPSSSSSSSHAPGVVRQFDGFSFSRIFQAGHSAAYYQPEAVLSIYARTMNGVDVATGQTVARGGYSTQGPGDSLGFGNGTLPAPAPTACNIWSLGTSCTQAQQMAVANGTAVVVGNEVVEPRA